MFYDVQTTQLYFVSNKLKSTVKNYSIICILKWEAMVTDRKQCLCTQSHSNLWINYLWSESNSIQTQFSFLISYASLSNRC
jgi:hypothetical protein